MKIITPVVVAACVPTAYTWAYVVYLLDGVVPMLIGASLAGLVASVCLWSTSPARSAR